MKNLTLGDLMLALRQLLGDFRPELLKSQTGRLYAPRIEARKKAIDALPDAASTKLPFAEELFKADAEHDGLGAALFHLSEVIAAHPHLSVALKRTGEALRQKFVPQLQVLRASYADEAAAALENRPELAKLKAELLQISVPGGGSAFTWAQAFLAAGDSIDALLRKRAIALATQENAAGTAALRASTVGLLSRFRDALRDEIADDATDLPENYEVTLFAYIDKLAADRTAAIPAALQDAPQVVETETPAVAPETPAVDK